MIEILSTTLALLWLAQKPNLFRLCVTLGLVCIDFMGVGFIDIEGMMV